MGEALGQFGYPGYDSSHFGENMWPAGLYTIQMSDMRSLQYGVETLQAMRYTMVVLIDVLLVE